MSLLHDRDFAVYCLRRGYLEHIHDGVGERVVHVDRSLYSRAWAISNRPSTVLAENPPPPFHPEFQYSPPIPKFVESARATALLAASSSNGDSKSSSSEFGDSDSGDEEREYAEDEFDTSEPPANSKGKHKRNGDTRVSSNNDDYDDDDDDDNDELGIEDLQRAARQIKFSKMPARDKDRIPDVDQMLSTYITGGKHAHKNAITDPSPSSYSRRNYKYTYPSDLGLAGNFDDKEGMTFLQSSSFRRGKSFDKRFNTLWSDIAMDDAIAEQDLSSSSVAATASDKVDDPLSPSGPPSQNSAPSDSGPPSRMPSISASTSERDLSRIIAFTEHRSNLSALIKASQATEKNPFEIYTSASGVGELKSLRLKLYRPTSSQPTKPFDVIVKPYVTVADTIGFSLYRYWEEKREPKLTEDEADISKWTLRIVEDDGEPDRDFPALDRTRIISAFSFDEFALVEATPKQVAENRKSAAK
ncbi:stress-activated map kinase interacting protein 1-domain-containing protein [Kockiozyma suomiensis]|uniref:stress-activated map kinase interacting protein 1-domain-containing protein n=1 Tax=Kockiozyma suomiensis TaxID=1337062 RepID=UPI0033442F2C